MNAQADADERTLRISIDTNATVHVGDYSGCGRSRGMVALKALDHDMYLKQKLVPSGILELVSGDAFLFFGTNYKTSDFMVNGLLLRWQHRKSQLQGAGVPELTNMLSDDHLRVERLIQRAYS